ncbi:helix-turn-helix domain-containing protein [Frankia sp. AgB1.9]|uniref:helix-turn-helix domain-containing protein n=1 Tax=unclassified Frankia TaxID=2632575 RepID=UPI001933E91F|nr:MULTISPECIES: helix-turn-helix transcriptional regulator [unclassified Frankia]MBL7487423.1 helix-turn-helix domain-containing protein [Frankia sp. AgW1.1]MBL7551059.1 helix-turn-helix domain-containing protein [Frankia sp. AgB1.9]MBL7618840.1 helix-turn-helix domain-containing protein [Frankia sp. AgB1.8]
MPRRPPSARTRGLGAELRDLRAHTGLTSRAAADRLGWHPSTLSRLENGLRAISPEDVAALLVVYQVTGDDRERLLTLAREIDRPGWWETGPAGIPNQLTALIGFEAQATRITDVAMLLVPGLLQTPGYARAVMIDGGVPAGEVDARVATRLGRQAILNRAQSPELHVLLDDAAIRRPVGGPAVMADQLRHLAAANRRHGVTVQVLPFGSGAHPGVHGSWVTLQFEKAPAIVHLEHLRSSLFVDDPADVQPFLDAADTLATQALDPAASSEYLTTTADEYERR